MTIMADAAARDMIDDDALSLFEASYIWTDALNASTRLVTCNHALIGFWPCALVHRTVNRPQVAATEGRGFHTYQYLSVPRLWYSIGMQFKPTIPR